MLDFESHLGFLVQNLLVAASLRVEFRQCQSRLACVAYLPAIPPLLVVTIPVLLYGFEDLVFVYGDPPGFFREALVYQPEVELEDFLG